MTDLTKSVAAFVAGQHTRPVENEKAPCFPYAAYYWRVVACMLLSGRIAPKNDSLPNMTDVHRICKEANFNPYLTAAVGAVLIESDIISHHPYQERYYREGPFLEVFWSMEIELLRFATGAGCLSMFAKAANLEWQLKKVDHTYLTGPLALFFGLFPDQALQSNQLGSMLNAFISLPEASLISLAQERGIDQRGVRDLQLATWLSSGKSCEAVVSALYGIGWATSIDEEEKWLALTPTGEIMLGLADPPPPPQLPSTLDVDGDGTIRAGAGSPWARLVSLMRHCRINKMGDICEFSLSKRSMSQVSATAAVDELSRLLRDLEPLPDKISKLLVKQQPIGGKLAYRPCSGIVKPQDAAMVKAIRAHPKLKGYLEAGAPPGYLLIKPEASFNNFLIRCQEAGFTLTLL